MSNGVFIRNRRPKSKKEVKEALKTNPSSVYFESLSAFGGFSGFASEKNFPDSLSFVGPDPFKDRSFYGTVQKKNGKIIVK